MQWYYSKNGTQLGPVAQSEMISKVASGEVSPSDLVWKEGMADWIPASRVNELAVISTTAPVASSGSLEPSSPYVSPASPYAAPTADPGTIIPNYLWQSIVVTLLCCLPFGIAGIVYASKVDTLKAKGDIPAAMLASANAKKWTTIGFFCGLVLNIIIVAISVMGAVAPQVVPPQ